MVNVFVSNVRNHSFGWFPNQEVNPGRGSESAETRPLDHQGTPNKSLFT